MESGNRKIIFNEYEEEENKIKVENKKLDKAAKEAEKKRLFQEKMEEDISNLRKQYLYIAEDDGNGIYNFEKKSEYLKNIMLLMLSLKSSGMIGVFGLDSDELIEQLLEKLRDKELEEELNYNVNDEKKLPRLPYMGCIQFRESMPNIYLPISSLIFSFYDRYKDYLNGYTGQFEETLISMTTRFFRKDEYIDSLNNATYKENNNGCKISTLVNERYRFLRLYYIGQNDDNFIKNAKFVLNNISWDVRLVIWVKAYKYDFDLFEKLYKLAQKTNVIIIVTTLCDIDVVSKKLSDETLCSGDKIINKFFNFKNIITFIEV